jgi:hypothetical protein
MAVDISRLQEIAKVPAHCHLPWLGWDSVAAAAEEPDFFGLPRAV